MIEESCERALSSELLLLPGPDTLSVSLEKSIQVWPIHTHATMFLTPCCCAVGKCYIFTISGYIGEFEIVDDHRSQKIVIELTGRLNKCGVISPRFDVEYGEIEKWIVNLLPSRQFGHIIISTTYGIMTHEEARRKKTGGKILGFFY